MGVDTHSRQSKMDPQRGSICIFEACTQHPQLHPTWTSPDMRKKIEKFIFRIILAGAAVAAYALTVGIYPRLFDIEWDEEVQLHDGRVIVVHVKHTYERLHKELGRYTSAIHRDTEITFDPRIGEARITQILKGGKPLLLDEQNGAWLLVFSWSSQWSPQLLGGQNWGPDQNGNGQRVAKLEGSGFKPTLICTLPEPWRKPNLLSLSAGVKVLSDFNGKSVTLQRKEEHLSKYPLLYGEARIERPANSTDCLQPNK